MPVIAVINRKGGSGKTTLSTNLAAWLASKSQNVMLGDTDRQQSVRAWEVKRPQHLPKIQTWSRNENKVFRAPPNTDHVILDTPGAIYDHELSKILVWVDAVIIPIGPSLFDQDASVRFIDELRQIPRVRSKRCSIAAIGMRWSQEAIQRWKEMPNSAHYPLISAIDDDAAYPQASALGMGIFEYASVYNQDKQLEQWQPVFTWIELQTRLQRVRMTPSTQAISTPLKVGLSPELKSTIDDSNNPLTLLGCAVSSSPESKTTFDESNHSNQDQTGESTVQSGAVVLRDELTQSEKPHPAKTSFLNRDVAAVVQTAQVPAVETITSHKSWWDRLTTL